MADAKLTALSALAAASSDDLFYIVDDPLGTPVSKKITVAALLGAVPVDLLPASAQSLGSATLPWLSSFVGSTTQYETVVQTAGSITHAALGSATDINIALNPKGTGVVSTAKSFSQVGGTTASSYLRSNSSNLASSTSLNPGFLVFGDSSTNAYGMDIGASASTFGLRLFSPNNVDFAATPSGSAITAQSSMAYALRVSLVGGSIATVLASAGVYGVSSNTNPAAAGNDTGLSRISAGLWGAGTGVQGSFAGGIKLTTLTMAAAGLLSISSGTNQRAGNLTLVGGTQTVSNATVTANTIVMLTRKTSGGTIGTAITYTVSAGSGFTVNSDNILDTSTFSYFLVEVP